MLIMTCKAILIQRKQIQYRKFVFAWLWWSRAFCCNSVMGCLCPGSQPLTRIPPGCIFIYLLLSEMSCSLWSCNGRGSCDRPLLPFMES
jgi:hypothetical protein